MNTFIKKITALMLCGFTVLFSFVNACADGDGEISEPVSVEAIESQSVSEYVCLYEATTGKIIAQKNGKNPFHMGHLAKLMTIYLTARQIDSGEIELETEVVASPEANGQGGTQIWLDSGERITVEELLKSITIGNANDACYALSEALFKTEDIYLKVANETAVSLGMSNTHFADATGMNDQSVTTAEDMAILAGKITEFDYLERYFCTWIDYVRDEKTELVNTNRLVRSYDGITGMKSCYDETSKNSVVATAGRKGMNLVCVASGCEDADLRFTDAKNLLDYGFSAYEIYTPEIPKKALEKIQVVNGSEKKAEVSPLEITPVLVKRGVSSNITAVFERKEFVKAPVEKNTEIGEVRLVDGEGVVFETKLVVKENVPPMTVGLALKRLWLNLLNLG
ncbi:MAG: D-alanyl-D-alanine carboxypeptidase [Ruminococcus sp.]|nr:D-alanyl-D-alanine carboxypeptidase [Ruminococcus sp.]